MDQSTQAVQDLRDEFETYKTATDKKITTLESSIKDNETSFSTHRHTMKDGTPRIQQADVVPSVRAAGSITMATTGRAYKLGIVENPTQVTFTGAAIHSTDGSYSLAAKAVGATVICGVVAAFAPSVAVISPPDLRLAFI